MATLAKLIFPYSNYVPECFFPFSFYWGKNIYLFSYSQNLPCDHCIHFEFWCLPLKLRLQLVNQNPGYSHRMSWTWISTCNYIRFDLHTRVHDWLLCHGKDLLWKKKALLLLWWILYVSSCQSYLEFWSFQGNILNSTSLHRGTRGHRGSNLYKYCVQEIQKMLCKILVFIYER